MKTKQIDSTSSKVFWTGKKIGGKHSGSIRLKDGFLNFENDELVGGEMIVDMASINSEDLEGDYKKKLEDHLHSDDFFSTKSHPTSMLKITQVKKSGNTYKVLGDMEIKGISKPVEFDLNLDDKAAKTAFQVDRTDFDIKYASNKFFGNLGDKALKDHFTLEVDLQFKN